MLPPINIDISDVIRQSYLNEAEVRSYSRFLLDGVAQWYMRKWREEKNVLGSTRQAYEEAMSYEYIDDFNIAFILSGKDKSWIALALELGKAPYDLREGFRKSPKAHYAGTDDWYINVPFRIATPDALAESSVFSDIMPDEIYTSALRGGVRTSNANLPANLQVRGVREEINRMDVHRAEYTHRSGRWEGIQRSKSGKYQGTYTKFRRVSENSDDNSWWHKGFEARHFMENALTELTSRIGDITDNIGEAWFGRYR